MDKLLERYATITLEEMKSIRLMNRIDTKFVMTENVLSRLLDLAKDDYLVQETLGERNIPYLTVYWDTNRYDMFYTHQSGHVNRQKLRFRTYVNSNLQFMEVKTKNNHGRTNKVRMQVGEMEIDSHERMDFLSKYLHYEPNSLRPVLQNQFRRVTLVNNAHSERLTIDTGLCFHNLVTNTVMSMEPLVIVELKRDGLCHSPVLDILRELRVFPHGFSKYCIGSALTNERLQVNLLKPKLTSIRRIANTA